MVAGIFIGIYIAGLVVTFISTFGLVCLGGKSQDLWIPFIAAIFWPIALIIFKIKGGF